MPNDPDREQAAGFRATHDTLGAAAHGLAILHRLVPAPDHGRGFRRDPETGFVYYSSEWLSDEWITRCGIAGCENEATGYRLWPGANSWGCYVCDAHSDPKPSE